MILQLTYHVEGTNNVGTPIDYTVKAKVDTNNSNSISFNTCCALNGLNPFLKKSELRDIVEQLISSLRETKLSKVKNTHLVDRNYNDVFRFTIVGKIIQ